VSLTELSDEEYNSDGSFEFPPLPRSVEQHVAFWSRVQIADSILMRVQEAYEARWTAWSSEQMAAWNVGHPVPSTTFGRADSAKMEQWRKLRVAAEQALAERRPPNLEAVLARTVVRATQMRKFAGWLDVEADYKRVLAHEVDLGGDGPMTVQGIEDLYLMHELQPQEFEDPGKYAGLNAAMAVSALHEIVGRMRDEDGGI